MKEFSSGEPPGAASRAARGDLARLLRRGGAPPRPRRARRPVRIGFLGGEAFDASFDAHLDPGAVEEERRARVRELADLLALCASGDVLGDHKVETL